MTELFKALVAAQSQVKKAEKNSQNPHYRSKYANYESVLDACNDALNKNGLAVYYSMGQANGSLFLTTTLCHTTGAHISTECPILLSKQDMQGLGSAYTYAKRYSLEALMRIASSDDDGNLATEKPQVHSNDDPGEWVINFGKHKGQRIKDLPTGDLEKSVDWVKSVEKKEPISLNLKMFKDNATEYLQRLNANEQLDNDANDETNFV